MHDQDVSDADDVFCICLFVGQVISSDVGTGNWGWSTPRGDQHKMASTQETFFLPYFLIFFIIEEYWDQSPKMQKYYRWLGIFRHYREILLPLWNIMGNITGWRRNIMENFNSHFPWLEGGLWCGSGKNFVATIRKHIFTHHWPHCMY